MYFSNTDSVNYRSIELWDNSIERETFTRHQSIPIKTSPTAQVSVERERTLLHFYASIAPLVFFDFDILRSLVVRFFLWVVLSSLTISTSFVIAVVVTSGTRARPHHSSLARFCKSQATSLSWNDSKRRLTSVLCRRQTDEPTNVTGWTTEAGVRRLWGTRYFRDTTSQQRI